MDVLNTQKDYDEVASIVMLVYGVGGVGKTTFTSTFPKPLLLDFENGAKYFKQRGIDIDVVKMMNWFTTGDKQQLSVLIKKYKTIVLDPIGEAMDKLIKSDAITGSKYRQSDGGLTIAGWGKVKDDFRSMMKWLRDTGKHVVLVAHSEEKADEDALTKRPMIATRIADEIIAMVDIVGYLDIIKGDKESDDKRVLRVNPADRKFVAKDRTGALDVLVKPEFNYIMGQIKRGQKEKKPTDKKPTAKAETKVAPKKKNPFKK